jgi:hypothetical protein
MNTNEVHATNHLVASTTSDDTGKERQQMKEAHATSSNTVASARTNVSSEEQKEAHATSSDTVTSARTHVYQKIPYNNNKNYDYQNLFDTSSSESESLGSSSLSDRSSDSFEEDNEETKKRKFNDLHNDQCCLKTYESQSSSFSSTKNEEDSDSINSTSTNSSESKDDCSNFSSDMSLKHKSVDINHVTRCTRSMKKVRTLICLNLSKIKSSFHSSKKGRFLYLKYF